MDSRHISETELDELWFSGDATTEREQSRRQDIVRHCSECSTCQDLLNNYLAIEGEIQSLRHGSSQKDPNQAQCPGEELWLKMLADAVDEDQAMRFLKHATACNRCAQHLLTAQKFLAEDLDPAPERKSTTAEWHVEMARRMVGASRLPRATRATEHRRFSSWSFWVPVTAGAFAVLLIALLLTGSGPQQEVETLLGQAYGENRTLEPRLTRALYGPLKIERGPNNQSRTNKPPALLKAEESLSRHLRAEPENPVWLDLKGRADLLDGNYAAALKSLQDALQIQPDSIPILTDAATAYFEIAEIVDRPQDYGKAIELLSRALSKKTNDPIALYNRALISEKMFLYQQAIQDWEHYLQLDSKGEWAEEATQHLIAVRKKLGEQDRSAAEPVLEARAFLQDASIHRRDLPAELESRAEEYLDRAIHEWLPIAFPASNKSFQQAAKRAHAYGKPVLVNSDPSVESQAAAAALRMLSEMLMARHDDHWLSDLLNGTQSIHFPLAVRALQQSIHANSAGDFAAGREKSMEAARLFRQAKNRPGEMRARCEAIYALERSFQEKDRCLAAAAPLASELQRHQYPWIQVQLYLEQSNCWSQIGDFGQARRYVQDALSTVEKARYPILRLRAIGMAAALDSRQGEIERAYSLDRNGLAAYWSGNFPPIRAYQFYSDLGTLAEAGAQWNFALALAQEAVAAITLARQPLGEAFGHHRLAKIALMAGDPGVATHEFDQAKRMFGSLPQTKETWAYEADAETELAKLQAARGDAKGAWSHLSAAGAHISQISHYSIALSYYKTLADIERMNGNTNQATDALYSAVSVAESGLATLKTEDERLRWARETNIVYRQLAEFLWRSHETRKAWQMWELYRGAAVREGGQLQARYRELWRKQKPLLAAPLFDEIPALAKQTTLSYMQVADGLIAWVADDQGVSSTWIKIPRQNLDRLVTNFRDECADRNSNLTSLQQHAKDLYNLLIAPIAGRLSQDRLLVIEPDESMVEIPIAALIDPGAHYLNENYTIVVSLGLFYQRHLRESRNLSSEERTLVVGSPAQDVSGTVLEPLEEAAEEARYIATKFRPATLLIGSQATLERVKHELGQVAIFHFAGHGVAGHDEEGLLLAPSPETARSGNLRRLLDTTSVMSMRLNKLQLAVFSACSTAGEGENNLGKAGNLVRFFLAAGVPHVVASRWNVDSKATINFMQVFYDKLLIGNPPSVSLRIAARELQSRPLTAHPYYWAAFAAFGN